MVSPPRLDEHFATLREVVEAHRVFVRYLTDDEATEGVGALDAIQAALRSLREDSEMAGGCLDMVREDLEAYGVDMKATPPMMYNDALRSLVALLGLRCGFTDTTQIAAAYREGFDAAKKAGERARAIDGERP